MDYSEVPLVDFLSTKKARTRAVRECPYACTILLTTHTHARVRGQHADRKSKPGTKASVNVAHPVQQGESCKALATA